MSGVQRTRKGSLAVVLLTLVALAGPAAAERPRDEDRSDRARGRSEECRPDHAGPPGRHHAGADGRSDCGDAHGRQDRDAIHVSRRARRTRVVELLQRRHAVLPLRHAPGHVVVTAEDLASADVRRLVRESYEGGYVVGITSAREDHARLLAALAGATSTVFLGSPEVSEEPGAAGEATTALDARRADDLAGAVVLLRRHDEDGGGGYRIHSLWVEAVASRASGKAGLDWLGPRFQRGAPAALPGATSLCAAPQSCLQEVAQAKVFEAHTSVSNGDVIEMQNEIYSTRSFGQGLDYYFVNQTGTYNLNNPAGATYDTMRTVETSTAPTGTFVVDVAPATTTCTDTLITSVTRTIGSSTGVSTTKGGATLSGGVQYGTQNRLNCSDLEVRNRSRDTNAEFDRKTIDLPPTGQVGASTANQFVYVVPFDDEKEEIGFKTTANLTGCKGCSSFPTPQLSLVMDAASQTLDFPFPTTAPVTPKITSVTPGTTPAGGIVTIAGEGFYSTALAALTIDGVAVPTANILPPDGSAPADQQIRLLMPSAGIPENTPLPVVVHTVFGISNDDQTITLTSGAAD